VRRTRGELDGKVYVEGMSGLALEEKTADHLDTRRREHCEHKLHNITTLNKKEKGIYLQNGKQGNDINILLIEDSSDLFAVIPSINSAN